MIGLFGCVVSNSNIAINHRLDEVIELNRFRTFDNVFWRTRLARQLIGNMVKCGKALIFDGGTWHKNEV